MALCFSAKGASHSGGLTGAASTVLTEVSSAGIMDVLAGQVQIDSGGAMAKIITLNTIGFRGKW